LRFAWSETLEEHEGSKQGKSDETCSEPHLSAKDSEDTKAQGTNSYKRNENVPAHLKFSIRSVGLELGSWNDLGETKRPMP
jgi:hypothetical protein